MRKPTRGAGLRICTPDTSTDSLVQILKEDGGLIIEGLLSSAQVSTITDELAPSVGQREPGFRDSQEGSFYGPKTVRIQGLAAKSPSFVDSILLNQRLLDIADAILLDNCGDYWMSQAETIYIGPGEKAQFLHRDDVNWSRAAGLGINLQISALIAVGDYDAEVGATMVVPRSHLLPYSSSTQASDAQPVELNPGDALVYLGGLVHGGGANITEDRVRRAIYIGYLLGWLTPEEAVSHSITPEVAARLPQRARELLGWANIHGNTNEDSMSNSTQLWQLDQDDLKKSDGLFIHR